ncbi:MAG: type I restriction enzyme HsdR N-terminal domain-containing protein [Bacteroidales bacterium]|nr:type I restriction enzyme HsdR N-terminal domain-containing protein [Bacteroidales bacterium]
MRESIFDPVRKKRVALTPEESVRQQLILELSSNLGYPLHLMSCEYSLVINRLKYRGDLVIFDRETNPIMIAECKAPDVKITRESFEQIVRYNSALKVKFLLVTNGRDTFMGKIDPEDGKYTFITEIPNYNELS